MLLLPSTINLRISFSRAVRSSRALSLAESALRAPGVDATMKAKAVTLAGLAACNTKNAAKAKTYYNQVAATRQTLLRQACLKQGIDLAQ